MTDISPLSHSLTTAVLAYLNAPKAVPSLQHLEHLLDSYTRTVPWESAFRIVKRQKTVETGTCPRWPEEFWEDAMTRGGGGTCFESNLAFFSLLRALDF
jgi:arylamine N-acetyltransferase